MSENLATDLSQEPANNIPNRRLKAILALGILCALATSAFALLIHLSTRPMETNRLRSQQESQNISGAGPVLITPKKRTDSQQTTMSISGRGSNSDGTINSYNTPRSQIPKAASSAGPTEHNSTVHPSAEPPPPLANSSGKEDPAISDPNPITEEPFTPATPPSGQAASVIEPPTASTQATSRELPYEPREVPPPAPQLPTPSGLVTNPDDPSLLADFPALEDMAGLTPQGRYGEKNNRAKEGLIKKS